MPPISSQPSSRPQLFAKVFKVINGLKGKQGVTVHRIAGEVHTKLEQLGLTPNAKRVLVQVRRALKFGVKNKLLFVKQGRYYLVSPDCHLTDDSDLYSFCSKQKVQYKRCTEATSKQKGSKRCKKPKSGYRNPSLSSNDSIRRKFIRHKNRKHEISSSYIQSSESLVTNKKIDKKAISYEAIRPQSYQELNTEDQSNSVIYNKVNNQFACSACALDRKSEYMKDIEVIKPVPERPNKPAKAIPVTEKIKSKKKTHLKKRKKRDRCVAQSVVRNDGNNHNNNIMANMSASTAIAAAIMLIMSLWYGYR